jgi:protein-S-isoprenylcysteine O-methyltransferase Ste14
MTNRRENILIYLAALLTLSAMVLSAFLDEPNCALIRYLALVFGVSGLCLVFWPMFTLRRYGRARPRENYMQTTTVVDHGLYTVVRHPLYLGYMCLSVTFMLISPHWLIILVASVAIMLFYLYAHQEEERLKKKFGRAYQEYMGRVPRFNIIGGLIRRVISGGKVDHG